jgi:hypothetical protein
VGRFALKRDVVRHEQHRPRLALNDAVNAPSRSEISPATLSMLPRPATSIALTGSPSIWRALDEATPAAEAFSSKSRSTVSIRSAES